MVRSAAIVLAAASALGDASLPHDQKVKRPLAQCEARLRAAQETFVAGHSDFSRARFTVTDGSVEYLAQPTPQERYWFRIELGDGGLGREYEQPGGESCSEAGGGPTTLSHVECAARRNGRAERFYMMWRDQSTRVSFGVLFGPIVGHCLDASR